jgi:hypothetical protein
MQKSRKKVTRRASKDPNFVCLIGDATDSMVVAPIRTAYIKRGVSVALWNQRSAVSNHTQ